MFIFASITLCGPSQRKRDPCRCPDLPVQYGHLRVDQIHRIPALCKPDDSNHGTRVDVSPCNPSAVASAPRQVCEVIVRGNCPCLQCTAQRIKGHPTAFLIQRSIGFKCLVEQEKSVSKLRSILPVQKQRCSAVACTSDQNLMSAFLAGLCCRSRPTRLSMGLVFGANRLSQSHAVLSSYA